MSERLEKNSLKWFRHVQRLGNERLFRKVSEVEVEGFRLMESPCERDKQGCWNCAMRKKY